MQTGTPPDDSGSGEPYWVMTHEPLPTQPVLSVQLTAGFPEQNEPTLAKKVQSLSPSAGLQPPRSPEIWAQVWIEKLCDVPVQPVSRSAPGRVEKVSVPILGHVQSPPHAPGHALASLPSQLSAPSRTLLPQNGAHVQLGLHVPAPGGTPHEPWSVPSHASDPWFFTLSPQYGLQVQLGLHPDPLHVAASEPSHCSLPVRMPLPQAVVVQLASQPSPLVWFPSSHCSPGSTVLSPQNGAHVQLP